MLNSGVHVYIHIPFCVQICSYCDFCKTDSANSRLIDAYLQALEQECLSRNPSLELNTLYIGGGTPSRLGYAQLDRLLTIVTTHLDLSNIEEFTFEADPCTITSSKLKLLKQAGVSRVSIGSQSLNDVTLAEMNRIHRAKDIVEMIPLLYQQGLSNLNCDFIVGWPGQTFDDVDLFIGFLEERNIAHCSCYVLGVEDDTPLKVQLADGTQQLPPDDMTADLYHHFRLHAQKIGLIQYELSNFARPGFESKHNQAYWRHKPYIGLGAGAVSYDGAIRSKNTTNIQTYTETPQANRESETLSEQDRLNEVIMLSLRTSDGLDEGLLNSQHLVIIDRLIVSGFMKKHGHKYFINPQHYCIANSIIADLIQ